MGVIDNLSICPMWFNAFEELKTKLGWLSHDRTWRRLLDELDDAG
jgi:hypothetical protein